MSGAVKDVPIWRCNTPDHSLWIKLKLPWAKSCGSPVELQRMRKHKCKDSAKLEERVSDFKLQSYKVSTVLYATTAYIKQIAHWSVIRTSPAFILCLFSGNFEHILLLYSRQPIPKFISSIIKKNWKVTKSDICLHRLMRMGHAVTLKMSGGAKCHQWPLQQCMQQSIDKASKSENIS